MNKEINPKMIARTNVHELFPGLSSKYLANLKSLGKGPQPYKVGRRIFYLVSDIEGFMKKNPLPLKAGNPI